MPPLGADMDAEVGPSLNFEACERERVAAAFPPAQHTIDAAFARAARPRLRAARAPAAPPPRPSRPRRRRSTPASTARRSTWRRSTSCRPMYGPRSSASSCSGARRGAAPRGRRLRCRTRPLRRSRGPGRAARGRGRRRRVMPRSPRPRKKRRGGRPRRIFRATGQQQRRPELLRAEAGAAKRPRWRSTRWTCLTLANAPYAAHRPASSQRPSSHLRTGQASTAAYGAA